MQSSRFLPGSVLVQVQPGAPRGRSRSARHFVANEDQAGSNPVVRSVPSQHEGRAAASYAAGVGSIPTEGSDRAGATGETSAFQADQASSILVARSTRAQFSG
jgi:hypothetical protein